jgi:hypothetical protein
VKKKCPKCEYQWSDDISSTMFNLRKVRFLDVFTDKRGKSTLCKQIQIKTENVPVRILTVYVYPPFLAM